ncbi:MAG TPA: hypothetical protein VFI13_08760 [Gemmatimonadales bacterium]|nr:hypothetical protein [Gemmatimonadales bacterium]
MTDNPFDHERDAELGALLRAHLDAGDHAAFARRVRAAVTAASAPGPFEVLGAWLRPGIAAAAVIALLAGWYITLGTRTDVASATPVEIFTNGNGTGTDVMLAISLEGR